MKKFKFALVLTIASAFAVLFNSCSDEGPTISNSGGNSLKGAYILYFGSATGTTDYAFYDAAKDSVTDFVFGSNNPGVNLGSYPGEMMMNSDRKLYITTRGNPNSSGTIYKIDPLFNNVIDSLSFGVNPFGFAINNNRMVVSNSGSTNVTVLDLDFNIIKDTIETGPAPGGVLYCFNKYVVTRIPPNAEPSVALVNEISNNVTKLFYQSAPVSAIYNVNGIFIATQTGRTIYRIDSESFSTIDSFIVPTLNFNVNDLVFRTQNSFYAICFGREIWLAEIGAGTITFTEIFPAVFGQGIKTAAYEQNANELYIVCSDTSGADILKILDGSSGNVKRTKPFAGHGASRIVFRYF